MPRPTIKARTVSYLRAQWTGHAGVTLQQALEEALRVLPTESDTVLPVRDGTAAVRHRRVNTSAIYLHVAGWTAGESASIVPHRIGATEPEEDLDRLEPGDDWDYLDGDAMALISDDHCVAMASGMNLTNLGIYLGRLLARAIESGANMPEEQEWSGLLPIGAPDIAQQIRDEGVRSVTLNVGQYLETAMAGQPPATLVRRLGQFLLSQLFENDVDRRRVEDAENVSARLVVSFDGRRAGLSPADLVPVAELAVAEAAEDGDDIEVVTMAGHRFKRGQMLLRKPVKLEPFGKTVGHNPAWDELTAYFNELGESGLLEV